MKAASYRISVIEYCCIVTNNLQPHLSLHCAHIYSAKLSGKNDINEQGRCWSSGGTDRIQCGTILSSVRTVHTDL